MQGYAARGTPVAARLTALGYYLDQGTREDLPMLEAFAPDSSRVPSCAKGAEGCEWTCEVESGGQQVAKTVQTVGEFVQFCVVPAISARAAPEKSPEDAARGNAEKTAKN